MESEKEFIKKRLKEDSKSSSRIIIYYILLIALVGIIIYIWPFIEEWAETIRILSEYDDDFKVYTILFFVSLLILAVLIRMMRDHHCAISAYKKEYEIRREYEYKHSLGEKWTCTCGEVNDPKYIYCKSCNTKRNVNSKSDFEGIAKQEVWVCKCGTHNEEGKVCGVCGNNKFNLKADGIEIDTLSEWYCENCGRVNHNTVGTCGCGQRKP